MELKAVRKSQPLHGTGPEADSLRGEGAGRRGLYAASRRSSAGHGAWEAGRLSDRPRPQSACRQVQTRDGKGP